MCYVRMSSKMRAGGTCFCTSIFVPCAPGGRAEARPSEDMTCSLELRVLALVSLAAGLQSGTHRPM